jgi:hypothetical protein
MRIFTIISCITAVLLISSNPNIPLSAQQSYEDYMYNREKNLNRDRPLSEIRTGDSDDVMDDIRGAVREEIDESLNKERKASKKKIDKNRFIRDIRQIVREEIEDAIKIKEKNYLNFGTVEIGGFLSYQVKGLESDENDNNTVIKLFPMLNYFIHKNVAIGLKGEADLNLTRDTKSYNAGIGPVFIYGIDNANEFCFYASIFAGASMNSALYDQYGYRYGNEIGIKFILTSGVIMNLGVMIVFDNAGDNVTGFQNIIEPTIGISAWF